LINFEIAEPIAANASSEARTISAISISRF
jgi:hypothetical protein